MIQDLIQREEAIDPTRSFIIQAPAGSGKTEILTQRYLKLLCRVEQPENIVALTFTRKAANEMRERIFKALSQAETESVGTSPHQQKTYLLAKVALEQDKRNEWSLLHSPHRLRIMTIDALCQQICQFLPLKERQFPTTNTTDSAYRYFKKAALACLRYTFGAKEFTDAIKTLLLHMDNQQTLIVNLFTELLSKRDQWLNLIYEAKFDEKETLEKALCWIESHEIERFIKTIDSEDAKTLLTLVQTLLTANQNSPGKLLNITHLNQINSEDCFILGNILLTSQNTLRKAFDHHVGLKKESLSKDLYQSLKAESKTLLAHLNENEDFIEALIRIRQLPKPYYSNEEWTVLQALFKILPLLVAHLNIIFSDEHCVDFTAVANQAMLALGNEHPTDVALYLDYQIHHLLIDEFQDTSIQQFDLLSKIIHEWHPNEGKTLFLVGDPMQSIYRFRAAEVGLFLRAKQCGIGPIKLEFLEFTSNFRSEAAIVSWVNTYFPNIFPKKSDIQAGAISFSAANSTKENKLSHAVEAYEVENEELEAFAIIDTLKKELTIPEQTIAILVRSRTQLKSLIAHLKKENIAFQGVEIDFLSTLPHLRDVWSLTQIILQPTNSLPWLCFLRSPWVGFSLQDMHLLCNTFSNTPIYVALERIFEISSLSESGKKRGQWIYAILNQALLERHKRSLVDLIITILEQLHQSSILTTQEQQDLEQYWSLLSQFKFENIQVDLQDFEHELNKLFAQKSSASNVQIMTIHKSKGLEFDTVILPSLSSKSGVHDKPLLRWLKLPTDSKDLILLSPIKAKQDDSTILYDYLGMLENEKHKYELQRLLYVAVTRAKKKIYLFDHKSKSNKQSFRGLLNNIHFENYPASTTSSAATTIPLLRLSDSFYNSPLTRKPAHQNQYLEWSDVHSQIFGVVAHELLEWIGEHHPTKWDDIPFNLASSSLRSIGIQGSLLNATLEKLKIYFERLFQDSIGYWIVSKHPEEKNEFELLLKDGNRLQTKIIDRTFVADGYRWIIDFKTGFNPTAHEKHLQQVNQYAKLMAYNSIEPIRCGLYYLDTNRFIQWHFETVLVSVE